MIPQRGTELADRLAQKQEKASRELDAFLVIMVIREGLEPSTQWLKAICSTD